MEINSTYYIDLVTRYFYGEATPEEIVELEAWVKAGPANAALFSDYWKTWKTVENARIGSSIDLDHEWDMLATRLRFKENDSLQFSANSLQTHQSEIVHRKSKISYWFVRIAAIFLLLAVPAFFLYRYVIHPAERQLFATGEMMEQTLPDGTVVTLNAGATLSCPSRFEGPFRKVTLQGEAWFEVAHDKTRPFVIASGNTRIRVVGTSFYVNTMTPHDTKEVILSEGTVKVYYDNEPGKAVLLLPGDKAEMVTANNAIIKTTNADVNFLAWKTKYMVFNNSPLNEVVTLMTKVYHKEIRLSDDRLNNCRITATFDRQSLESVLNVLKATLDLQVSKSGAGIEISGHGCQYNQ